MREYYAGTSYNELRERRSRGGGAPGGGKKAGGKGGRRRRRRRKADNTRQGQAVFKCVRRCCCGCLHGETFLQTTMAAGQPSFFFCPPGSSASSLLPPARPRPSANLFFLWFRAARKRAALPRKNVHPRAPFRVYHRALLLIVGKYSDTVTRGEFLGQRGAVRFREGRGSSGWQERRVVSET